MALRLVDEEYRLFFLLELRRFYYAFDFFFGNFLHLLVFGLVDFLEVLDRGRGWVRVGTSQVLEQAVLALAVEIANGADSASL